MKENILLPFDESKILSYPFTAFSYSVLKAHFGASLSPALTRRYINCYYIRPRHPARFIPSVSDHWCENYHMVERQYVDISLETLQALGMDPVAFFQKSLKVGAYIYGKSKLSFLPEQVSHDRGVFWYFVIGYDDSKGVFYTRMFDNKQEYYTLELPYSVLVDTIWENPKNFIPFYLCTVHKDVEIPLKMHEIARELEDYVLSKTSEHQYSADKSYGMQAIAELNDYLYQAAREGKEIEIFYLRALSNHKYFMRERIVYLAERGEISGEWIPRAQTVCSLAEPLVVLGERYNQTKDASIAKEIQTRIESLMEKEKAYLPKVLEEIAWYLKVVRE